MEGRCVKDFLLWTGLGTGEDWTLFCKESFHATSPLQPVYVNYRFEVCLSYCFYMEKKAFSNWHVVKC